MPQTSFSIESFLRSRTGLLMLSLLALGGIFLIVEHAAHAALGLPYALLLLCPLIHLFMHRGHAEGHGDDHQHLGEDKNERP